MTTPDLAHLPYLVDLVDDESPLVRDTVLTKLAEYGDGLEQHLRALPEPPSADTLQRLRDWLDQYRGRVEEFHQQTEVGTVLRSALFKPGDLVCHRRYGYRGVVVNGDASCQAGQDWYRSNRSQPDRDQPWYHVLIHESDAVSYAAQTSLLPDTSKDDVRHALVPVFFDRRDDGRYARNDNSWPRSP